jgi:hypothetical protein
VRSIWTPGPEIASTERAMPPRSITSSRMSPKSDSRATAWRYMSGVMSPAVVCQ